MRSTGLTFGSAVTLGVLLFHTVLPLPLPATGAAAVTAATLTLWNARAWPLVPLCLGVFRSAVARAAWRRGSLATDLRATGWIDVIRERPGGAMVRVGSRHVLVADSTGVLPPPGYSARGMIRMDRILSRAERSQFRADEWARSRGVNARGRCVGAVEAIRPTPGGVGAMRRLAYLARRRARRRLDAGRSDGRDLVTALVIGDRGGLEPDQLDAFRRAGLAHVLALSGMHVGVLALGLGALLRVARVPAPALVALTIAFLGAFAFVTGASAPILRACGTGSLAIAAGGLHRRLPPGHALGLVAGTLLLVQPALLFDVGCRLSFLAAGTLAVYARHAPRPGHGWRGARQTLWEGLRMSACVTLATSGEILASFGAISLLSPITNLLAVLPATLALGWGALAAFAPATDGAAAILSTAAARAADVLLAIATLAAKVPGGRLLLPTPGPALVACTLATAGAWTVRRRPSRRQLGGVAALALLAAGAAIPRDRITFLDLGQGDATLIEGGGGAVLVDTGLGAWQDRPARALGAVTMRRLRPLSALVLTHGHADHAGGAEALIAAGRVRCVVMRARAPNGLLERIRNAANAEGLSTRNAGVPGLPLLGGRLHVRPPWREDPPVGTSENDRSLFTRWEVGSRSACLLGDGGFASEAALVAEVGGRLRADVLLVPHHGSRGSSSTTLLGAVRPHLAVISCGKGNPYGHPHAETLAALRRRGIACLRTDRDGTITLTTSPRGFRIRWVRAFPGPFAFLPGFRLPGSPELP